MELYVVEHLESYSLQFKFVRLNGRVEKTLERKISSSCYSL